ncbi:hypothetical protein MMC29_006014 [Sticta canariensis]|nr:hypothetical protein [Sticta canariensis]
MEYRASIPVDLPPQNPTSSYWQDPPSPLSARRTTPSLPSTASIVIVGSGITGASLAYYILKQPNPPSVLMLEARSACSGATGRNGGHTKCASYLAFMDNIRTLGEDEAARIARLEYNCMKSVHIFAREHNIECDSWEGDTVDIIYDDKQWKEAKTAVSEIGRVLGTKDPAARYTFWNQKETEYMFSTKDAIGAVSYEAGSLSAYKFVIGMLNLSLEKGLNLQTETPVLRIGKREDGRSGWNVQTWRGEVKADRVILATNGYTARLYPKLQGIIVPLRGHMTVQRPGSGLTRTRLSGTYSFIYENGYEYMIQRPQGSMFAGDIAIGGGLAKATAEGLYEYGTVDDTTTDPAILDYLRNSTLKYFGSNWGNDDPEGRIRKAWTGIMGYSADGFPIIGQVPNEDELYIAASFQGLGMVLCFNCAKALVQIMNNTDEELTWFPMAYRITEKRMSHTFIKKLQTTGSQDLETKSPS